MTDWTKVIDELREFFKEHQRTNYLVALSKTWRVDQGESYPCETIVIIDADNPDHNVSFDTDFHDESPRSTRDLLCDLLCGDFNVHYDGLDIIISTFNHENEVRITM